MPRKVLKTEAVAVEKVASAPHLVSNEALPRHVLSICHYGVANMGKVSADLVATACADLDNNNAEPFICVIAQCVMPQCCQACLRRLALLCDPAPFRSLCMHVANLASINLRVGSTQPCVTTTYSR